MFARAEIGTPLTYWTVTMFWVLLMMPTQSFTPSPQGPNFENQNVPPAKSVVNTTVPVPAMRLSTMVCGDGLMPHFSSHWVPSVAPSQDWLLNTSPWPSLALRGATHDWLPRPTRTAPPRSVER